MTDSLDSLKKWIDDMAALIERSENPNSQHYSYFLQEPEMASLLIDLIAALDEEQIDSERAYYSACVFALEICVAQLQAAAEANNKLGKKTLNQLMSYMAEVILNNNHSLSFWLPILNAFYEVHVELSDELKNAYFELVNVEDVLTSDEEVTHLNAMRDLIEELSDLSSFDIAENFFAQSYAMPPDFFMDLIIDLYSIEEGHDIAILTLLHPKQEVRDIVVSTYDQIISNITLSSLSLTRLQVIKNWYPKSYHAQFNRWIKIQRKKGIVFQPYYDTAALKFKASEIDGTGAQGIFIELKKNRKNRLCGLLVKQQIGIKDAWLTPIISAKDIVRYNHEAFDDTVMLRKVNREYLQLITNHFLAITIEQGGMPDLHLLEIQEEIGAHFVPERLDVNYLLEQFAVQITPFTPETIDISLRRSKAWTKNKRFTESWYLENAQVDKLVNRCCNFVDGVKVCRFEEAMDAVFLQEMEKHREWWTFHFLWMALWLRGNERKSETAWQDSFIIAYVIHQGSPLSSIPILKEICYQSIVNSIETMHERRTHLNQE